MCVHMSLCMCVSTHAHDCGLPQSGHVPSVAAEGSNTDQGLSLASGCPVYGSTSQFPPVRGERPFWMPAVTHVIKTKNTSVRQWRSRSLRHSPLQGETTASDRVTDTQVLWKAGCHHRFSHLQCPQQSQNTEQRWPHSAPELSSPNSPCLRCDFDPLTH